MLIAFLTPDKARQILNQLFPVKTLSNPRLTECYGKLNFNSCAVFSPLVFNCPVVQDLLVCHFCPVACPQHLPLAVGCSAQSVQFTSPKHIHVCLTCILVRPSQAERCKLGWTGNVSKNMFVPVALIWWREANLLGLKVFRWLQHIQTLVL